MRRPFSLALLLTVSVAIALVMDMPQAAAQTATTTTLTTSANPAIVNQNVTYTATVVGGDEGAPVQISIGGRSTNPIISLHNGVATTTTQFSGLRDHFEVIATYLGDANTAPSSSAPIEQNINASLGLAPTSISVTTGANPGYVGQTITYSATVSGGNSTPPTGTVSFYINSTVPLTVPLSETGTATLTDAFANAGTYPISASYSGDSNNAGAKSSTLGQVIDAPAAQPPLQFVPVTPCRVLDTRNAAGPFGGPAIGANQTRTFPIPQSACGIPATAAAYSLNVTAVPDGSLNYLTVWPAGQAQPVVSLLNSLDGRVKANAAIVPAGTSGAISVYANAGTATNVIVDINGYFTPAAPSTLQFYSVLPCRAVDTRNTTGPLGGPYLPAGESRAFPLQSSNCQIPPEAQAYSLNVTAIPAGGPLNYLTTWPTGKAQPNTSTLNAPTGTTTANAAIVPAGTGGSVSVYASNNTEVLIDVNGYFAPPGVGGTSLYTTTPCRVFDSRSNPFPPFPGTFTLPVEAGPCNVSTVAASYVLNATVVPPAPLNYLTLWAAGTSQPDVSTLNAADGSITSNMAIVTDNDGVIDIFASDLTQLLIDVSSYFAP